MRSTSEGLRRHVKHDEPNFKVGGPSTHMYGVLVLLTMNIVTSPFLNIPGVRVQSGNDRRSIPSQTIKDRRF